MRAAAISCGVFRPALRRSKSTCSYSVPLRKTRGHKIAASNLAKRRRSRGSQGARRHFNAVVPDRRYTAGAAQRGSGGQCGPAISSRDLQRRSEGPFLDVAVAHSEAEIEPESVRGTSCHFVAMYQFGRHFGGHRTCCWRMARCTTWRWTEIHEFAVARLLGLNFPVLREEFGQGACSHLDSPSRQPRSQYCRRRQADSR